MSNIDYERSSEDSICSCNSDDNNDSDTDADSSQSSTLNCCLICSVLCSLSHTNCCTKHLALLLPAMTSSKVIYVMPGKFRKIAKWKSRHHLQPRKRTKRLLSDNTTEDESTSMSPNRLSNLSSSINTSTMTKSNISHTRNVTSSLNEMTRRKSITETCESSQNNPTQIINAETSSEISPRILLERIIHVKEEGEESVSTVCDRTLTMTQAARQIFSEQTAQPRIFLKRINLDSLE